MQSGGIAVNDMRARVAYLHGLAEGLDLDQTSAEGRVLSSMLDLLQDMADQMADLAEAQDELVEYVEDVDFDLGALEGMVYQDDDDDDEEIMFVPDGPYMEEEDGIELAACPQCGETLAAGYGLNTGVDVICPSCGIMVCDSDLSCNCDEEVMMGRN